MQAVTHVSYTSNDALAAAEALRQEAKGHRETAEVIKAGAGLEDHTEQQLRGLCDLYLVDV
jgi:hypothetical protein